MRIGSESPRRHSPPGTVAAETARPLIFQHLDAQLTRSLTRRRT
jgi:hypothetical protein